MRESRALVTISCYRHAPLFLTGRLRMAEGEGALRPAGLSVEDLKDMGDWFERGAGYRSHQISKRRGGSRTIFEANVEFSSNLKLLRQGLQHVGCYEAPNCVHGYVKGRSILTNAQPHLARPVVLGVDLQDFFPSISADTVAEALERADLDDQTARLISRATTVEQQLPAGFSTSPFLSNMVFHPTDLSLLQLSEDLEITYTRFADDLSFSGDFGDEVLEAIRSLLADHGWSLNDAKTRFMRRGGPQYVTGLYVGAADRPYIPRRVKRRLRQRLHYMAQFGFADVHQRGRDEAMFENQSWGWLRYVGQVEPWTAARLQAVLERVDFDDEYLYWADPDDWSAMLDDIGM